MNKHTYIPFVDDDTLVKEVKAVINTISKAINNTAEKTIFKNAIDPFSAIFEAECIGLSLQDWLGNEKMRQNQKTLQNAIGNFHQNILGSIDGWESLPVGGKVDVRNFDRKIVAEIKNKYNTCNSKSAQGVFDELNEAIKGDYKGFTAYHVQIIPKNKKEYDKIWSHNKNINEKIRLIDGKTFYKLASGYDNAIELLYKAVPIVISNIRQKNNIFSDDKLFEILFEKTYKID